jgi:formylglycine-generating enzyme required for sulfatase activity
LGVQGACATVARLDEYLTRRVPEVVRECLGSGVNQYPYSIAEPISKSHLILMPNHARPEDLNALKMDALRAEKAGNLRLALQCWLRVNIASRGLDNEALDEIVELRLKLRQSNPIAQPKADPKSEVPLPKGDVDGSGTIGLPTFKFQYATIDDTLKIQKHDGTAQYFRETINGVDLDLVPIAAGSFDMGSDEYDTEKPIHRVTVPEFFMGKYPVTQEQWKAVAQLKQKNRKLEADPSHFKGADRPVENVSWNDAVEFCDRLSEHTGNHYRLPSEAEWEYACRAGTTTLFHFGATIDASIANYDGDSTYGKGKKGAYREQTTPVGSFPANAWGLSDCHGNVWEFCADNYHGNYKGAPTDGSAWTKGGYTECPIVRGGSWINEPVSARSSQRGDYYTHACHDRDCGFRVVLSGFGGSPRILP